MARAALEQLADLVPPPGELGLGDLHVGNFVNDVFHLAAKGVQRRERATAFGRQEQERVVVARAARRGLLSAVLVGSHKSLRFKPLRPETSPKKRPTLAGYNTLFFVGLLRLSATARRWRNW